MADPMDVDTSFSASLRNIPKDTPSLPANVSFSTTESDSSDPLTNYFPPAYPAESQDQSTPKLTQASSSSPIATQGASLSTPKAEQKKPSTPVQHGDTKEVYDQWATVYDTDGNMLQSIDDIELSTLLPHFLRTVESSCSASWTSNPDPYHDKLEINIIDLGCGTGRNTIKLFSHPWPPSSSLTVRGLDFSSRMLYVAAKKLDGIRRFPGDPGYKYTCIPRLFIADCFPTATDPGASPLPVIKEVVRTMDDDWCQHESDYVCPTNVDAIISTLVLEHIPLRAYFSTLSALLKPGGYALITNMHSDMGAVSQAGFVNTEGTKVRAQSFAHTVEDTIQEATRHGFEVIEVRERAVEKQDMERKKVGERGWKWVGVRVWYGVVVRKGKGEGV